MAETQANDAKAAKAPKAGDEVRVVLADGTTAPAILKKVDKNGKAELEFEHRGETVTITSAPFDPQGKKADSWCAAAATEESK